MEKPEIKTVYNAPVEIEEMYINGELASVKANGYPLPKDMFLPGRLNISADRKVVERIFEMMNEKNIWAIKPIFNYHSDKLIKLPKDIFMPGRITPGIDARDLEPIKEKHRPILMWFLKIFSRKPKIKAYMGIDMAKGKDYSYRAKMLNCINPICRTVLTAGSFHGEQEVAVDCYVCGWRSIAKFPKKV